MLKKVSAAAVLVALAIFCSRAWGEEQGLKLDDSPLLLQDHTEATVVESEPSDWHFRVGFNLMAGAITGTAGHQKTEIDVDAGLDEVFDNGTIGLEFQFEAGTGPWSIIFDAMWMHLGDDAKTSSGSLDADFDGDFGFIDIAGGYEFKRLKVRGKTVALDALLGFRWTDLKTSIQVKEGATPRPNQDTSKDFVDPYVGIRARAYLSDKFTLIGSGTVGGLGVGSDLLATGELALEYRLNETWWLVAGYRAYYYDYDDDFQWKVTMHGPFIGIAARF
jgi:hypothetical protein